MAIPVIVATAVKMGGAMLAEKAIDKAIEVGSNSLQDKFSALKGRCEINEENREKRLSGEEQIANATANAQDKEEVAEASEQMEQVHTMQG